MAKTHWQATARIVEYDASSSEQKYTNRKGLCAPFFMLKNMQNKISAREIKDNISLVDLLSRLGFEPAKRAGNEKLYLSMLRDSDNTPSFSVNDKLGTWYDHGEGKGGNIIDFGLQYWKGLSFQEVLEKIISVSNSSLPDNSIGKPFKRENKIKEPNYQILEVKELCNSPALLNYLESRCIGSVANGRLKEIYYYVEDDNKNRKNFFAVGWQNETGDWEIRSALDFKGCLGHKAISFIPDSEQRLSVFEGYFNYLSWLTDNPFANDSVLVLNSLSLLQPGIEKAKGFPNIFLFLDNDPSGRQATLDFQSKVPAAIDCAGIYTGYNDYNDRLVADRTNYQLNR
jgi:hypothetical protein